MPFRNWTTEAAVFTLIAAGVLSLFTSKKRRTYSKPTKLSPSEDPYIAAMKKVVDEHNGWTAEVIKINVFGRRRVETFRLLSPGREIELRMKKGNIRVFAFGEYISELIVPPNSNLPRLFNEHISFDAYLGGREQVFMNDDTYDSCSIIVFYKLEGFPPTKVNLL